jgi:disulfide bond formation protein DsbB
VTPDQVALFFGVLALSCQLGVLLVTVLAVGARWSPAFARAWSRLRAELDPYALGLAFAVAGVATVGSLYFSEVAHFRPCVLCWSQRIFMYPLAVVLGIAWWRRDGAIRVYAIPLAALGAFIASYHVVLERFPSLESGSCDPAAPCTTRWVEALGYLTIPTMALTGFITVIVLLLLTPQEPPP